MMVTHGVSRLPVYRGDLDHTEGIVHVKDVLESFYRHREHTPLTGLLHPVRFVPESNAWPSCCARCRPRSFTWPW